MTTGTTSMPSPWQLELQRLAKVHDGLKPQQVVDEARDPSSPLHPHFEWDDTIAAEKHRLDQARQLIARCKFTITTPAKKEIKVRTFISTEQHGERSYKPVEIIASDDDLLKLALDEMKRDFERLEKKWASHREYFDAMIAARAAGTVL